MALLPLAWVVAVATVAAVARIVAEIRGLTVQQLFRTDTLWPLTFLLPTFLLGLTLGFIGLNVMAYLTPPLRRVFEREERNSGRHGFTTAIRELAWVVLTLFALTMVGVAVFVWFGQ